MKKKSEKGYAIIVILVLAALLLISLSTTASILLAFNKQNKEAESELKMHEKTVNQQLVKE